MKSQKAKVQPHQTTSKKPVARKTVKSTGKAPRGPVKSRSTPTEKKAPPVKRALPRKNPAKALIKPKPGDRALRIRPLHPGEVSAMILRDLTRNHSDVCNFLPEASLAQKGEVYLAYVGVKEKTAVIADATARHVWVKAQAEASLKKIADPAYDRWPGTIRKWTAAEHRCKRTNSKLEAWQNRLLKGDREVPYLEEITRMREFVAYVIGVAPDIDRMLAEAHHGPGSTVGVTGNAVHIHAKRGSLDCTSSAAELAAAALVHDKSVWVELGLDPTYSHLESAQAGFKRIALAAIQDELVSHDKLMFIHKGIDSYRSIGAQPTLNAYLQLGIDNLLKGLMMDRIGLDLSDQTRNQRLALKGSLHHDDEDPICTMDKTDASNLIAKFLIPFSFPGAWSKLLLRTRVASYLAPNEMGSGTHVYHMYAGMGNGTTFSVETLLFTAMLFGVSDCSLEEFLTSSDWAVYGDDVIARRSVCLRYIPFVEYLGLRINRSKTFLFGSFRESCGADYSSGINVRPAYVKCDTLQMHELELIGVHNTLVDHPEWKLLGAAQAIRTAWEQRINVIVPTDPAGGLGFRPCGGASGFTVVRDKAGKPILSSWWQRPRFYVLDVRAKLDQLERIGPWTQLATALSKGRQVWAEKGGSTWALPYRNLVNIRMKAEEDMSRKNLVLMLRNQLRRLSVNKQQPWYEASRGLG